MIQKYDLVVIGGGPAGMAAALTAEKRGVKKILLLERERYLGGILQQCIHNGFGLQYFKEELTGPEYALRFIKKIGKSQVEVKTETMVIRINQDKQITALNKLEGLIIIEAKAVIMAMGCRERSREAVKIPGDRPAGIFTAGTAQRYTNLEGYLPGKEVIILGSGDIGLIMARRMTLEGARVKAVLEIMPYSTGLTRNIVQCLEDFNIPLLLNHTITRIIGEQRVEKVRIAEVDRARNVLQGTEKDISCDTVLFSVGLIPENELSREMGIKLHPVTGGPRVNEVRETEIKGVFACGNVLHVHDLVDYVTEEAEIAGTAAAEYLSGINKSRKNPITLRAGKNISYVLPLRIDLAPEKRKYIKLFMRVKEPAEGVLIKIKSDKRLIARFQKRIVTPGEMLTINLAGNLLTSKLQDLEISLEKEEGVDLD